MEIVTFPAAINLSGNFPKITGTIELGDKVVMDLFRDGIFLLREFYDCDSLGNFEIDLLDVVTGELELSLPGVEDPIINQAAALGNFSLFISSGGDSESFYFKVVKCGVGYPVANAAAFLSSNFLTWQPQSKLIKQFDPEWLTYYAALNSKVKVKAFFSDHEPIVKNLIDLPAAQISSFDVKFSIIDTLFNEPPTSPIAYDIWIETLAGAKLSFTQRYMITKEYFEFEDLFVFENTAGGIDTIRFTGEFVERKELTIKKALFDKTTKEFFSQNTTVLKKNTGIFRTAKERVWALEFFLSLQKFVKLGEQILPIYIKDPELEISKYELASGDFEYALAQEETYYSAERIAGVLPDPNIFIPDPEEPPTGDNQQIFTEPFTNQFK